MGMSKVDLRRFRRAVNEAMKADADAVAAAQAAAAEAERIQAAEVAAAAETAAKAAAAAAKEAKEGPPKWKLQAMPPQEMLKEVLTWRFPPNPEEADPVSGEPGESRGLQVVKHKSWIVCGSRAVHTCWSFFLGVGLMFEHFQFSELHFMCTIVQSIREIVDSKMFSYAYCLEIMCALRSFSILVLDFPLLCEIHPIGPHACTYLELIAAIKVATGKAWLTAYKPNHGGLVEFLKKYVFNLTIAEHIELKLRYFYVQHKPRRIEIGTMCKFLECK